MFPGHWGIRRESVFFASDDDDDVTADDSISLVATDVTSGTCVESDEEFDAFVEDEGEGYEWDEFELLLPVIDERPVVSRGCVHRGHCVLQWLACVSLYPPFDHVHESVNNKKHVRLL